MCSIWFISEIQTFVIGITENMQVKYTLKPNQDQNILLKIY